MKALASFHFIKGNLLPTVHVADVRARRRAVMQSGASDRLRESLCVGVLRNGASLSLRGTTRWAQTKLRRFICASLAPTFAAPWARRVEGE
jgi:hypothetical protein